MTYKLTRSTFKATTYQIDYLKKFFDTPAHFYSSRNQPVILRHFLPTDVHLHASLCPNAAAIGNCKQHLIL